MISILCVSVTFYLNSLIIMLNHQIESSDRTCGRRRSGFFFGESTINSRRTLFQSHPKWDCSSLLSFLLKLKFNLRLKILFSSLRRQCCALYNTVEREKRQQRIRRKFYQPRRCDLNNKIYASRVKKGKLLQSEQQAGRRHEWERKGKNRKIDKSIKMKKKLNCESLTQWHFSLGCCW